MSGTSIIAKIFVPLSFNTFFIALVLWASTGAYLLANTWIIVDGSYQLSDHAVYQPKQAIGPI